MGAQHRGKIDSQALGLDIGLAFARFLTGRENLHYGDWTGLAPNAANLGAAQEAYTARLFSHLPEGQGLRILDIGGGAGETAAKLMALGHRVEIVIPSPFLAGRCRENAPGAIVHEARFEDMTPEPRFDLALFSESFQYVPLDRGLALAERWLVPGGRVLVADCFRTPDYDAVGGGQAGGGHPWEAFRAEIAARGLTVTAEEDITEAVAPTIDLEQAFFNVIGHSATRIDAELGRARPWLRRFLGALYRAVLTRRRRDRLEARLLRQERNSGAFRRYNRYVIMVLTPGDGGAG